MKRILPFSVLTGLFCLALLGCSSKGSVLTGTVTLDGKALPNATVEFLPVDREKGTGGDTRQTNADGKFETAPGRLKPGKYAVFVSKWVRKDGTTPPPEELEMERAAGTLKNEVPAKYNNKDETPLLNVEVKPGKNDPVTLALKKD